jgi:hypothetical protein
VDDKITKEQFCEFAMSAINSLVSMPDDMWEWTLPTITLRFKNSSYEVVVGLRDAEEEDDEAQATIDRIQATADRLSDSLARLTSQSTRDSVTIERYESALVRIADAENFGSPLQAIAAKALGDPPHPKQEEDDDI